MCRTERLMRSPLPTSDGVAIQLTEHPDLHRTMPGYHWSRFEWVNELRYRWYAFWYPPMMSTDNLETVKLSTANLSRTVQRFRNMIRPRVGEEIYPL